MGTAHSNAVCVCVCVWMQACRTRCLLGHVSVQAAAGHVTHLGSAQPCAEATRDETGFHSGYPECARIFSEITAKTYFVDANSFDEEMRQKSIYVTTKALAKEKLPEPTSHF